MAFHVSSLDCKRSSPFWTNAIVFFLGFVSLPFDRSVTLTFPWVKSIPLEPSVRPPTWSGIFGGTILTRHQTSASCELPGVLSMAPTRSCVMLCGLPMPQKRKVNKYPAHQLVTQMSELRTFSGARLDGQVVGCPVFSQCALTEWAA